MRESRLKTKVGSGYTKIGNLAYRSQKIYELIEQLKLKEAKRQVYDLLRDYPTDSNSYRTLASILILEGKYEEAEKLLKELEEETVFHSLTRVSIKLNREEEIERLYKKYYQKNYPLEKIKTFVTDYDNMQLYLQKKYNEISGSMNQLKYFQQQLIFYDEKRALNHIYYHHVAEIKENKTQISKDIKIEELFYQIKNYIIQHPENARLGHNIADIYQFYYPNCGFHYQENGVLNYLQVVTIINTSNIISIYPHHYRKILPVCEEESKKESKVKVKSGLERFHNRYGNL